MIIHTPSQQKNPVDKIVFDLFKITNPKTEELIPQLEIDAGYIFVNIEITKQKFGIYLFPEARAIDVCLESEDWLVFKQCRAFES